MMAKIALFGYVCTIYGVRGISIVRDEKGEGRGRGCPAALRLFLRGPDLHLSIMWVNLAQSESLLSVVRECSVDL